MPRPPQKEPIKPKVLPDKIIEKVVYMVAKDPEGQMVSIVGGALMVFMIGVCIACVCRAQRRKLRKIEKARRESLRESAEMPVPQVDLPTFE